MDLSINLENYKLNIRAAGIIIHDNKILVHKNMNEGHYALIGGRVELGEDSETTLKRELMEEIGKEVEITGNIGTIENFFEINDLKYHEILFMHQAEFKNEEDKKITGTMNNIEGKDYLKYEWLDIDKLEQYKLLPEVTKKLLKEKKFPVHKINIDNKCT